jgi:hypothetical protein
MNRHLSMYFWSGACIAILSVAAGPVMMPKYFA